VGPIAESNYEGTQRIVDRAIQWEKGSGATFESDKTSFIHFTRTSTRSSETPVQIKDQLVPIKSKVKLLGLTMDPKLRFHRHLANVAAKSFNAALAPKRLKQLSPKTARKLFEATVAPEMDYTSNTWMYLAKASMRAMKRTQRTGAQAIIRSFRTVSLAIVEAEAHIQPIHQRL
jgi:hypothetical protein